MSAFITITSDKNKNEFHINALSILYYAYDEEEDVTIIGVIGKEFKIKGNAIENITKILTIPPPEENSTGTERNVMMSQ